MKKYEYENKSYENSVGRFYKRLVLCFVLFLTVVSFCRFNPDIRQEVKSVLYNSYDAEVVGKQVNKYAEGFKGLCEKIESYLVLEE